MIAVVIGHRESSQGAANVNGVTEYEWNGDLARMAAHTLAVAGVKHCVVHRPDTKNGYFEQAMALNSWGVDGIIELHFNSMRGTTATGTETLCHPHSIRGRQLADLVQSRMVENLGLPDRGVKPTMVNGSGRELYTLTQTHAPAIIVESHFGSNARDVEFADARKADLSEAIALGIEEWAAMR